MTRDLVKRTRAFAIELIRWISLLPKNHLNDVLGRQILRCGTSVGALYSEVVRARDAEDQVRRMDAVCEEARLTYYWIDLLLEAEPKVSPEAERLRTESRCLVSLFSAECCAEAPGSSESREVPGDALAGRNPEKGSTGLGRSAKSTAFPHA
jgi:four helix bundle protein